MSLDFGLQGKLVFISGSTEGIGQAIASRFLEVGANVIINGRNPEKTLRVAVELEIVAAKTKARVHAVAGDVGSTEGVQQLVKQVEKIGHVDVLVNNAGIFAVKDFFEVDDDEWDRYWNVNVMSGVRLSRAFLKGMLERNSGSIINISSEAAFANKAFMIHYGTTKSAQLGLSRGLAELTKGTAVRVNTVLPGPTFTEVSRHKGIVPYLEGIAQHQGKSYEEAKAEYVPKTEPTSLIQRWIEPVEVANIVVFLASDLSGATNGSSYRAEGGILRYL
ncbi:short-chain dehydrogenase/reductase SDR [Jimgerdemannia flammicorona]|uniref:3-oxoacyl-[acyl-carrier-protein] reductase n=1 Tax=Jimgerdemannia flammicorona TaxID=994334 RepID=A0A433DM62_9FUNG|nr:short-chain dehydrogenase/reductase SDR [Jimgerdemannia flammicorona]